jgi:DNA-binding beta-propeller fold protein YncE
MAADRSKPYTPGRGRWRSLAARLILTVLPLLLWAWAPPPMEGQPLEAPVRLTLTPWGDALVSDYGSERVVHLARDGGGPAGAGGFTIRGKPSGLAWAGGLLFVGNDSSGSVEIHRLHRNGRWQPHGRLGRRGGLPWPTDLAADEIHRLIFVLSSGARRVEVFNFQGEALGTLAAAEGETATLVHPTALTADPAAREVYVSDYGDPRVGIFPAVHIFGYDGTRRGEISGETAQPGFAFSRPQGLAADGAGRLFLVDALLGQVLVFDRASGLGITALGSYGSGPGQLLLPLDVALDPATGDVLVTDNRNARLVIFPGAALP